MNEILTGSYKASTGKNKNTEISSSRSGTLTDRAAFQKALNSAVNSSAQIETVAMEDIFKRASEKYGVDIKLLKAVARAESNFNPDAVSSCGAKGVMQLMPVACKELGVTDPFDPEQNIMGGAKCLKQKLDEFGDVKIALAAYNAGSGAVKKYNGIPPYSETQNYVKKVTQYYSENYDLSDKNISSSAKAVKDGFCRTAAAENPKINKSTSGNISGVSLVSVLCAYAQMSALMPSSGISGVSAISSSVINNSVSSMLEDAISDGEPSLTRKDYNSLMQLIALQMQQSVLSGLGSSDNSFFGSSGYFNSYASDYMSSVLTYLDRLSSASDSKEADGEADNAIREILKDAQTVKNPTPAYTASDYVNLMSSIL